MSLSGQQSTQVHDGFATIRTRGQSRSIKQRPDQIQQRYRTKSLKADYQFTFPASTQSIIDTPSPSTGHHQEPIYSNSSSLYQSALTEGFDVSSDYLPQYHQTTTSRITGQHDDREFLFYASPDSPKYGNINKPRNIKQHRSCNELDATTTKSSSNSITETPEQFLLLDKFNQRQHNRMQLIPSLQHTKIQKKTESNVGGGGDSSGEISSISSAGSSGIYNQSSPRLSSSYNDSKNIFDFYNPDTNYYSPFTTTTNPVKSNRCSSAELLDVKVHEYATELHPRIPKMFTQFNQASLGNGVTERRYHTLGHFSGNNQKLKLIALNKKSPTIEDRLEFKIGCQTTLRSKPKIPWYELAIKNDLKRNSCPPIDNQAHVVAAFEQSLSNMTTRLQQLTANAEQKDGELTDMRQTIELLRKQSIQAGLTTAHMQSMGVPKQKVHPDNQQLSIKTKNLVISKPERVHNGSVQVPNQIASSITKVQRPSGLHRNHSSDSMCSLNSISSGCSTHDKKKKKGWLRSSFSKAFSRNAKITKTNRNVAGSNSSNLDQNSGLATGNPGLQDVVKNSSLPPPSPTKRSPQKSMDIFKPVDNLASANPVVEDLKKQLREKDLVLTDIRLEALSSASQLENLKDTVSKMRAEMMSLKQNNERLQKIVTTTITASGSDLSVGIATSPVDSITDARRYSSTDGTTRPPMELPLSLEEELEEEIVPPAPAPEPPPSSISPTTHVDLTPPPPAIEAPNQSHTTLTGDDMPDNTDGKKIAIAVYLGQAESFVKYLQEIYEYENLVAHEFKITKDCDEETEEQPRQQFLFEERKFINPALNEFIIAYTYISGKTSWQNLDYIVRKTFKDYVSRIDPGTNLGLNTDSITSYHLGEAKRGPEMGFPELLPCGYIVGNVKNLYICLQGVGSLAFDSLIPRSIVHRYISLLQEHRRLILCGPSGTGKSYLARKLAEFLVARCPRGNPSEAIATFNVDHKSSKELRQYLGHIAEQASMSNGSSELPSVIILDNLHHASALGDVFSCLLSAGPAAKLPCIIGTMSQATCNTTNLQLHHNFRWVLTANHMEPVKGFLGRFLRRRAYTLELQTDNKQPELTAVLAWLSTVWQHINQFLENHSSSDVTIGPRMFLSCPLDLKDSQVWFTDVWNYHLAPYLVEAIREGVQLYGRRGGAWNDPSTFIRDTYPWSYGPDSVPPLRQINADEVGLEGGMVGANDTRDPLLNMLMHLQEAANYTGCQEHESDCASVDSNAGGDTAVEQSKI